MSQVMKAFILGKTDFCWRRRGRGGTRLAINSPEFHKAHRSSISLCCLEWDDEGVQLKSQLVKI